MQDGLLNVIIQGIDATLSELKKDDSLKEKRSFSDLEKRLIKRKENSSSHKRINEIRKQLT